jgi:hypothetical protein
MFRWGIKHGWFNHKDHKGHKEDEGISHRFHGFH